MNVDSAMFTKVRPPCSKDKMQGGYCGRLLEATTSSSGVALGRLDLAIVQMGGVPFDGLLGADFLRQHTVYLDFSTRTAFVAPGRHQARLR